MKVTAKSVKTRLNKRTGATVWIASYRLPDGRKTDRRVCVTPAKATAKEKRDAEQKARDYVLEMMDKAANIKATGETWDEGEDTRVSLTMAELLDLVERKMESRHGSDGQFKKDQLRALRPLIPAAKNADQFTHHDVQRLVDKRRKQVVDSTIRKPVLFIHRVFKWAMLRGYLKPRMNPASADVIQRPADSKPKPNPLVYAEKVALKAAAISWLGPMIELGWLTGFDRSELCGLTWGHIDRSRKVITIARNKTKQERVFPYAGDADIERILDHALEVTGGEGHVFRRTFKGDLHPVTVETAKSGMRRTWTRAKLTKARPWKTLRATFATDCFEAGLDVPTVASLMGLSSAYVMDYYFKPSGSHLHGVMAKKAAHAKAVKARHGLKAVKARVTSALV